MEKNINLVNDPSRVTQAFGYDEKSKMIAVTHYLNLKEGEDAYLEDIQKFTPKDKKFIYGTLFLYRITNKQSEDENIPFLRSKKFPENGFPYRLSGGKHEIVVEIAASQN